MARSGSAYPDSFCARVVAEYQLIGNLKMVAARHDVNKNSVLNWNKRYANDEEFRALCNTKKDTLKAEIEADWLLEARRTLNLAFRRAQELIVVCDDLHTLSGHIKIVGELGIAREVLSEPSHHQQSEAPAEAEGKQTSTPPLAN